MTRPKPIPWAEVVRIAVAVWTARTLDIAVARLAVWLREHGVDTEKRGDK